MYCGFNEMEICSPLVIGQSYMEHEAWIELSKQIPKANGIYAYKSNTIGKIYVDLINLYFIYSCPCSEFLS